MVDMQRSLEEEVKVPGEAEVMKTVSPPHPRHKELRLKVGQDEKQVWWYFEQACCGGTDNGTWRKYRACKTREVEKLRELDGRGLLLRKPDEGPAGCTMVYYKFA